MVSKQLYFKVRMSAREIAQPVKCLFCRHKNLNSSRRSQALEKKLIILVLLGKQKHQGTLVHTHQLA